MSEARTELKYRDIELTAADLPLHCPMPSMKLWNTHPRVFIDVATTGSAKCPYCGTNYRLSGPAKAGH
ncbi:MAG TPA: zinc-finger domain-containing protein [Usitatibacteraceae bacterium]|nr:zinc-finger domain-containing protein [Usitatibacteraceae bacterium]